MSEVIRIEIPVEMLDKTEPAMSNITGKITRLGDTARKTGQTVSKFDTQTQKTEKSLQSWVRQKYQVVLDAKDKVGPILSGIGSNLKSFAGKTWNTTLSVLDLATKPIQGVISLLRNPILQAGAVLGISVSAADTINTYKDFEAQMSQVKAISGASGSDYERLNKKAQEMGATTKFTATEAAQGFNYMAMAGWNTDQMEAGIGGILSLAAASGEDLGTTSDIVTDALTAFNMTADDATHFADVLAVASSNANTNVAMMGETFKYVGAASGALGYSIEDVALGIGLMANAGIKSSQAGTELNSIFTRLSTNTNGARDAIESLGISFYDQNGNARDFGKVLDELRGATKGMNNEQKINLANTIAGQRAQAGLLAMLNASEADYRKVTTAIRDADGAAADMADTMLDNLSGSITKLQSAWEGLKLKLGERLSPYIKEFAEWLTAQTPKIADTIGNVMDKVDRFAQKMKDRWKDLTGSSDWANADFLGKLKLSWDKMIIEPLTEWWEGGGKAQVAHFAGEFGNFLGSALNMGIMGLFGFDAGGAIDEGASIGKSFAKGFSEGFDFKAVGAKILETIKNVIKSALKLLPGGEKGGLSSFLSAGLLGVGAFKLASPIASLAKAGVGVGKLVKTVFGAGATVAGAAGMAGAAGQVYQNANGTFVAGPATTAMGGLGLVGKILGLGTKAYGAFTGGAGTLTGGSASAAGLAGIGGAIIGGATVVSGGMDVYRAIKADDEKAKAAYAKSAGWKLGGVAGGAAIGAGIGAASTGPLAPLGALVGAGVGGIVGLIGGHFEKKKYEEEMARLEARRAKLAEVYKVAGVELDRMAFKSKELNDALEDNEMSAEEFGYMFQTEVADRTKKAFGDVKLSLAEVDTLARNIMFGTKQLDYEKYAESISKTAEAYATYQSAQADMAQQTWKVSLGMELSEGDIDSFKASVDSFMAEAQSYVEQSHYESTIAAKILLGDNVDLSHIDEFYIGMQKELEEKKNLLNETIEIALKGDYTIDTNEAEAISKLQTEVSEMTNKIAEAQNRAEIEAIKLDFKVSDLDAESFEMLQEQLQSAKKEADELARQTFTDTTFPLQLRLEDENLSEEARKEIEAQLKLAEENYQMQIKINDMKLASDQIDALAVAWGDELDAALGDIEGTTQEKLTATLNKALSIKPANTWTSDDIMTWLGLDKIGDVEASAKIIDQFKMLGMGISEAAQTELANSLKNQKLPNGDIMSEWSDGTVNQIASSLDYTKTGIQTVFGDKMSQLELDKIMSEQLNGQLSDGQMFETLRTLMEAGVQGLDIGQYTEPLKTKFEEAGIDISEKLQEAFNSNFENVDLFETLGELIIADAQGVDVSAYIEPLLIRLREADINLDGLGSNLSGSLQTQFDQAASSLNSDNLAAGVQFAGENGISLGFNAIRYHELTQGYGPGIVNSAASSVVSSSNEQMVSAFATKRSQWQAEAQGQLGGGMHVTVPVVANIAWQLMNAATSIVLGGAATGMASVFATLSNAAGGYVSGGPQLSWLAEEGWGEYIIPTNPSRRTDALRLYEEAGRSLGVEAHAAGGYVSGAFDTYEDDEPQETYSPDSGAKSSSNANVTVNLNMTPSININGASDPEAILDALRGELATMTNEMSATLAGQLKEVLTNIPHRKGAA